MDLQVVAPREGPVHNRVLEDNAARGAGSDGVPGHVEPGNPGCAAGWRDRGGEHADGRRLAGAVGAQEPEDLAGRNVEVDAGHGFDSAGIGLLEVAYLYGRTPWFRRLA